VGAGWGVRARMVMGPSLARRKVNLGRGARRGAFRAARAVFFMLMTAWLLGPNHVASVNIEQNRLFNAIGVALFRAGLLWLTYLGLEPYVRRFSPDSLVGWQRLVSGGSRGPALGPGLMTGGAA